MPYGMPSAASYSFDPLAAQASLKQVARQRASCPSPTKKHVQHQPEDKPPVSDRPRAPTSPPSIAPRAGGDGWLLPSRASAVFQQLRAHEDVNDQAVMVVPTLSRLRCCCSKLLLFTGDVITPEEGGCLVRCQGRTH